MINTERKKRVPAMGLQQRVGKSPVMKAEGGYGHGVGWAGDHTGRSWHEREEEDGEKRWWEAHRTSGIHLREGTGMQG